VLFLSYPSRGRGKPTPGWLAVSDRKTGKPTGNVTSRNVNRAEVLVLRVDQVRRCGLWPRSITQPSLTEGDRGTFAWLARMERRRPETLVSTGLSPDADKEPLGKVEPLGSLG
jgi:hypothetical protein